MSQHYNNKAIIANNVPSLSYRKKNYSTSPETVKYKKIGNYILSTTIGKGTFSKVKLGIHLPTQKKVAIKILDREKIKDESDLERITREIHILTVLRHPNIAQLYETITSERHIYIVMEYIEGRDLFQYIYSLQRLSELKSSQLFRQLIACIEYIHTLGIVHRDIKPENILLNKQKTILKLVDFGLSNSYKHGDLLKTACGSPCYAAPEMISGKEYNGLYSDLWSCGVVLYCMLVGKLPFDDEDIKILYYNIKNANYYMPPFLSNTSQDILRRILTTNPKRRISLEEIKNHPFFLLGERTPLLKGLLIGVENIPVDMDIIHEMKKNYFDDKESIDEEYIASTIQKNNHNNITTIYYLLYKEKIENIFNTNSSKPKSNNSKEKDMEKKNDENNIKMIKKKISSKEKKENQFGMKLKEIFNNKTKNKKKSKNYNDETISDINNNIEVISPNNDSSSRKNYDWKKSDNLFNLSTIKKISFDKKEIKEQDNNKINEVNNISNINNVNNLNNINNFNNISNINSNNQSGNRFNVLVINNFMSDQQTQNNSKNKNNSNILTINIQGAKDLQSENNNDKKNINNIVNNNYNNNDNNIINAKLNINDIIINKLQKKRCNSRNSKRLTNINYNYKKNKTESILEQSTIVKNENMIDINSFGNKDNNNKNFKNEQNEDVNDEMSYNIIKKSSNIKNNSNNQNVNININNENNNYKKLNTFNVKSFKECKKFILNSPEDSIINDDNIYIKENNKTMNNNIETNSNSTNNKSHYNYINKNIKQNKNNIRDKNYINNEEFVQNNVVGENYRKHYFKKYIKKLFDNNNNDNLSYNENTPLYLSNIAGNNNYNNKSINMNYIDTSSNNIKNIRNKSTNYKINNTIFKKIEKDKEHLNLNKSTNIEENKKNILPSDIRSIKSNYVNDDRKMKNNNNNNANKNINIINNKKNININQKTKKLKSYNSNKENSQGRGYNINNINIVNNINNINIVKTQMHNNSKKKKKNSGINEKLSKIFKERFSVSLKKNNSKGKESYVKTAGYPGYSISKSKSKSPNSYSQEKAESFGKDYYQNNIRYYGINGKKIKQKQIFGINNQFINQKLRNYNNNLAGTMNSNLNMYSNISNNNNYVANLNSNNTNYSSNSNNANIIRTNNFIKNINTNQKPLATPINKNNTNNKMNIGFAVNFSNVKRKILSKEKNNNINNIKVSNMSNKNNFINNINNLISNIHGINKINYNSNNANFSNKLYKGEFNSTHQSKEKNYGTMKSSSLNRKQHNSKNNSVKTNKNGFKNHALINNAFMNINSVNFNSKSKTKRTPLSLGLKNKNIK